MGIDMQELIDELQRVAGSPLFTDYDRRISARLARAMIERGRLIEAAIALADSVSFDDNGAMTGGKWMGGHGGLLSDDTRKKADEVRSIVRGIRGDA
jgi:hypothetical protein